MGFWEIILAIVVGIIVLCMLGFGLAFGYIMIGVLTNIDFKNPPKSKRLP